MLMIKATAKHATRNAKNSTKVGLFFEPHNLQGAEIMLPGFLHVAQSCSFIGGIICKDLYLGFMGWMPTLGR